ncbi:divalent metal cation transporter [Halostagnicola sp. A56]|uniref:divalent metal cation transporter n=1 Tax=Halostagnicola sp. A56 TaxID=1495067 RepID=UPI0012E149F1
MATDSHGIASIEYPSIREGIKQIGPAFIVAALMLGPGSFVILTTAGALYGYQLLWILAISGVFIIVYIEMIARIGIIAEQSF